MTKVDLGGSPSLGHKLLRRKPVTTMTTETGADSEGGELQRSIGLFQLTLFGVGATIGTGIFIVLTQAVSPGHDPTTPSPFGPALEEQLDLRELQSQPGARVYVESEAPVITPVIVAPTPSSLGTPSRMPMPTSR